MQKRTLIILFILAISPPITGGFWYLYNNAMGSTVGKKEGRVASSTLPVISSAELSRHNGNDSLLPIYIGLDGYIYDVTMGSKYYAKGGVYHALAGKDSTPALRLFGGDIIRKKYPIVGTVGE